MLLTVALSEPTISFWCGLVYWTISLVLILFYAIKAYDIFAPAEKPNEAQKIHNYWFNGLGALIGCVLLWTVIAKFWYSIEHHDTSILTSGDYLTLLFSFIGITGFMPVTVVGITQSLGQLINKLYGS